MTDVQWSRLEELFERALAVDANDRPAFINEACGDDDALREELIALLEQHEDVGGILDSSTGPWTAQPALVGRRVGGYDVERLIASGGMGAVYVAQQENPPRRVALKVMNSTFATPSVLRRFKYESHVLARLRHPNIAQVYEAGTHDDGAGPLAFFAMEYVEDAQTITEFAREQGLPTRERLLLFTRVCEAVHYGHLKGVIHRDLKPTNILIDSSTGAAVPKVIDFGVARAVDVDAVDATSRTGVGQLIGTLQYMSPEQCDGDPADLDMRSDVYSLGVVLFELLCNRLPYDIEGTAITHATRAIRERMPARPSSIDRVLRGDVELIVLKALEKDRERRYASAAELALDLRRFLNHEPIEARPPSVGYQLRMFARRHRVLSASVVAASVAVVAQTIVTFLIWSAYVDAHTTNRSLAEYMKKTHSSGREEILKGVYPLSSFADFQDRGEVIALVRRRDILGDNPGTHPRR